MLTELCKELNNWFDYKRLEGTYTVSDGALVIPEAQDGQFVRLCGSVFNDGVHRYPLYNLIDESFCGVIWLMAVPREVISLSREIDTWQEEYQATIRNPYQSESFGGYSYTKASGTASGVNGAGGITWQMAFADKLSHYRKAGVQ